MKLIFVMPATNATSERSSALKRVKSYWFNKNGCDLRNFAHALIAHGYTTYQCSPFLYSRVSSIPLLSNPRIVSYPVTCTYRSSCGEPTHNLVIKELYPDQEIRHITPFVKRYGHVMTYVPGFGNNPLYEIFSEN